MSDCSQTTDIIDTKTRILYLYKRGSRKAEWGRGAKGYLSFARAGG